jgi:hypothetical protein
MTVIGVDKSAA